MNTFSSMVNTFSSMVKDEWLMTMMTTWWMWWSGGDGERTELVDVGLETGFLLACSLCGHV